VRRSNHSERGFSPKRLSVDFARGLRAPRAKGHLFPEDGASHQSFDDAVLLGAKKELKSLNRRLGVQVDTS